MFIFRPSIFIIAFIIIPHVLSYAIDIYCPLSSRFKPNCESFFTISNLNLTNISIDVVSDVADIDSKMVIDLDGSLEVDATKRFIIFKPIFSYDHVCNSLVYYSFSLTKPVINGILYLYYYL